MPDGLPTKVAPFEHYMYADDRIAAPMTFFVRAVFSGVLDLPAFRSAVAAAQLRHPLSRAVIAGSRRGTMESLSWQPAPNPEPFVAFSRAGEVFPAYPAGNAWIDLKREVGLRFFLTEAGAGQTLLLMQVHHSVSDAIGAIRFLEDVLAAYDGKAEPRPLDASLLARRDELGLQPRFPETVEQAMQLLDRHAEPLVEAGSMPPQGDAPFPASVTAMISGEAAAELATQAKASGATFNDVLLRDLFLAIHRFQSERGDARPIRLNMPVDLRGAEFARMPMANVVGMAFVAREPGGLADAGALLAGISAETRRIKDGQEAAHFNNAAAIGGRYQDGLRLICLPTRCFSTAVLSNLVRPFDGSPLLGPDGKLRAGGLTLERCALLPPVRPLTNAALGVLTYAGRTEVALHFDANVMSAADASRLLALFVGEDAVRAAER